MPKDQIPEGIDTGYREGYQDSVKVESEVLFGMDIDEFYRRQTGLVLDNIPNSLYDGDDLTPSKPVDLNDIPAEKLKTIDKTRKLKDLLFRRKNKRPESVAEKADELGIKIVDKCNLDIGPGKKVLDLAAGEGDTSRYLATTNAKVDSQDLSEHLIGQAEKRDKELRDIRKLQNVTRARLKAKLFGAVDYKISDMGNVKETLEEDEIGTYDVVSILSRSFIYLGAKANYEKAVKDYFDVLKPGGKLVIQMRHRLGPPKMPWLEGTNAGIEDTAEGQYKMVNSKGDAYVLNVSGKEELPDGTELDSFTREMHYADGKVVDMGRPKADKNISFFNLKWVNDMLKKAGFTNISLKAQYFAKDDTEIMYAIVAEKPGN